MRYLQLLMAMVALCGMACTDFIEEPIIEETVELLSPGQYAESATYDIYFRWNKMQNAHAYQLQIASPNFDRVNLFYADTLMEGTAFKISLESGNYSWRVRAVNGAEESNWSEVRYFRQDYTPAEQ